MQTDVMTEGMPTAAALTGLSHPHQLTSRRLSRKRLRCKHNVQWEVCVGHMLQLCRGISSLLLRVQRVVCEPGAVGVRNQW